MSLKPKKILVPIDFSETGMLALEHAAFMARLMKADLHLLHVMPVSEYYFEIPEPIMRIENHDTINKIVEQKLNEAAEMVYKNYGIRPSTSSARGQVGHEVITIVNEQLFDLVVMGTHGAKGFEELFIGSNAHKVVTLAPCPVLTVQTHATHLGFKNIVLPIDRSQHSREKVDEAVDLASAYAAKIHIIGLLESNEAAEYDKLQIVLDQVENAVQKAGVPFSRNTIEGSNLAIEALKYGHQVNADLIVIMTDHESEMTGIFLGPKAKQIVNHSKIPVLSIKPREGKYSGIDMGGAYTAY